MIGNPFPNTAVRDNLRFFDTRADLNNWIDELIDVLYIVKEDEKYNGETTVNVKDDKGGYRRINDVYEMKQQVVEVSAAPKEVVIDIPYDDKYRIPEINVLKQVKGATNKTLTILDFTRNEASMFEDNPYVTFDGSLKLRTNYEIAGQDVELADGYIARSFKVDKSKFKNITAFSIV